MKHDTTISGGIYIVNGQRVDAHGSILPQDKPRAVYSDETPTSEEIVDTETTEPQKPAQRRTRKTD